MPATISPVASESAEQQALFQWAELASGKHYELGLLFAIPNGSHKSIATAMRFKREGLKAGVPDILLPVARGGFYGLFVELKRVRGGRMSEEQWQWRAALLCEGYQCVICKGWEEAAKQIENYLKGE
jgi:hypothetical protein